ncbi:hypothetical protein Tco_0731583 [Tanacetum coccineum]
MEVRVVFGGSVVVVFGGCDDDDDDDDDGGVDMVAGGEWPEVGRKSEREIWGLGKLNIRETISQNKVSTMEEAHGELM